MKNKLIFKLLILTSAFTSLFMSGCSNFNSEATEYRNFASKINQGINEVGDEFNFDTSKFIYNIKNSGYNITNYSVEASLHGAALATSYNVDSDKVYVYQYNTRTGLHEEIMNISELKKLGLEDELSNISHYYKQGKLLIRYEGSNEENLKYFNKSFKKLFI